MTGVSSYQPTITSRQAARRSRTTAVVVLLLLATGVISIALSGRSGTEALDPGSARPQGGRALVELLRGQGHVVDVVAEPSAEPDQSLVLARPDHLDDAGAAAISAAASDGADVLVVGPLEGDAIGVEPVGAGRVRERDPGCSLPAAQGAGSAVIGGIAVDPGDGQGCYPMGPGFALVRRAVGQGSITVLSGPEALDNDHLDDAGNAALALALLEGHERVRWVFPTAFPAGAQPRDQSLVDLLPDRVRWVALQLSIAVLVAAAWRARRLGPPVDEQLPVVVRAAESVQGRARLYAAGQQRGHAAGGLRAGARARLARRLGLGRSPDPAALVLKVAEASGRAEPEVRSLLYGSPAAADSDAALLQLAHDLDALDRQVRHP